MVKTLANCFKLAKFANVFLCHYFMLYGSYTCKLNGDYEYFIGKLTQTVKWYTFLQLEILQGTN